MSSSIQKVVSVDPKYVKSTQVCPGLNYKAKLYLPRISNIFFR